MVYIYILSKATKWHSVSNNGTRKTKEWELNINTKEVKQSTPKNKQKQSVRTTLKTYTRG